LTIQKWLGGQSSNSTCLIRWGGGGREKSPFRGGEKKLVRVKYLKGVVKGGRKKKDYKKS